jgi:hypothetical protein
MPKSETPSISNGGRVRCAICGNENAETNYYCGMCGAALTANKQRPVQPLAPVPAAPTAAPRQVAPAAPPVPRQTTPPLRTGMPGPDRASADSQRDQSSAPVITGPSFLGLNAPAPRSGTRDSAHDNSLSRGSQADDHLQHSSGNLDYLLDDDEEQPKGGWGKLIVVFVALLLALGFGYLRWRQGGFDWLTGNKNSAAVAPATPTPQASGGDSANTPAPSTPNAISDAASAPAATTPGQASSQPGADSSNPAAASSSGAPAAAPADSAAPQTNPPPSISAQTQTSAAQASSDSHPGDPNPSADSTPSSSVPPSDAASETRPSQAKATKPRQPKPTPAKPLDSVTEAERYIYGRGTRQDCDRGLRLLKPAADQNPKAMVSLGVLYTTGTCTPRDLPTAYRWFAMALHKEPDNQALQDDLQKLWSQMTPPERQLAIKLSQ